MGGFYADERLRNRAQLLLGNDFEPYFGLLLSAGANPNQVSALSELPVGSGFAPGIMQDDRHRQRVRTAAVYGDVTAEIIGGLELNLGLRYTDEEKRPASNYSSPSRPNACIAALALPTLPTVARMALCTVYNDPAFLNASTSQDIDTGRLSGTAKLSYWFSPQVLVYSSYANG